MALALCLSLTITSFSTVGASAVSETEVSGAAIEEEVTDIPQESETPATEGEEAPAPEGEETPAPEEEETPAPEGEETPAPEGEETPAPEGEETPVPEGEETPAPEGEETPAPSETPVLSEEPTVLVTEEENLGNTAAPAHQTEVDYSKAQWVLKSGKYQLQNTEDGNKPYTSKDGIVKLAYATEVLYYVFDSAGNMEEGIVENGDNIYYFTEKSRAEKRKVQDTDMAADSPVNTTRGAMLLNGWAKNGSAWIYMGAEGVGTIKAGWQDVNGDGQKLYLDSKGVPANSWQTISGKSYYFKDGKVLYKNVLKKIGSYYYGFNKDGVRIENDFATFGGKKYFFQAADGRRFQKKGWQTVKGSKYYFNSNYSVASKTGWYKIKDTNGKTYWFYFNKGTMYKSRVFKESKYYYYVDGNGRMRTGKCTVNKKIYYFLPRKASDGRPQGSAIKGWKYISGSWYYFNPTTRTAVATNGVTTIGSRKYFMYKTGKMCKGGFKNYDGKRYYFKGGVTKKNRNGYAYTSKWFKTKKTGGNWYYARKAGHLAKGWVKIKKKWYHFDDNYVMEKNKSITRKSIKGYLDNDGVFISRGWLKDSGKWKYIDPDQGFAKGWKNINGYRYYFDNKGYLSQDMRWWAKQNGYSGSDYRLEVNRTKCVVNVYVPTKQGKVPIVTFLCSVGLPGTPTPKSAPGTTFRLQRANRWQLLMGPSWGQYGSHVQGAGQGGIYFHSVSGPRSGDHYAVPSGEYNRLGSPASHGCIRLCVSDVKWIYDNCNGGRVYIYDSSSTGPFDKPTLPKITSGAYGKDPTDPAVGGKPSRH